MGMNETLKAIADPVRREILKFLRKGEAPAGKIAAQFELSGATVSYHLKILKQAGLVSEQRDKNYIYYRLNASVFEDVLAWVYSLGVKGESHEKD